MKDSPLISVSILNWNGVEDTLKCLKSLENQTYKNFEIIVVDNGSTDESVNKLKKIRDNRIKIIYLNSNTGFTGGHIKALEESKGSYIALLNNDLVVDKNWLYELYNTSIKFNADIVGGKSFRWDLNNTGFNINNDYSSFQCVNPITAHADTLEIGEYDTLVNSISGSNLLVKKSVIKKIGYLDNDFFAYYEETDLIARAKLQGYKCAYSSKALVWHKSGESSKSNPYFYLYQMHRNRYIFAYKNFDSKFLRKFKRHFLKELYRSCLIYAKDKNSLYDKALINAYFYYLRHRLKISYKRFKNKPNNNNNSYNYKILSRQELDGLITVAIPCYNYANFINDAVNSAINQTIAPAEIIIIDDGSSDDSLNVIKQIIKNNKSKVPIRYVSQNNKGIVKTKNVLLNLVKTPWLVFLDADDILDKKYLEETIITSRLNNSDVVYTDMQFFGSTDGLQKVVKYNKYKLRAVNYIHNSALMRTDIVKKVGGYSDVMKDGYEDWELYLKISKITKSFTYINKPLLLYRRHDSASRDILAQNKLPKIVKLLEKIHPDLYNFKFYFWLENNRLSEALKTIAKYPFYVLRHFKSHHLSKRINSEK